MQQTLRLVWDLPTRVFHWLMVLSVIGSYTTAKLGFTWMPWHFRLGYFMIGLLIFRVIWGLIGPRHARFSNFIKGPGPILQYLKGGIRSVGHNPLGAGSVVLMLLLLAVQVSTGLFSTDDVAYVGPYFPSVSHDLAEKLTGIHHLNFNFILAIVALHLLAILYYTFVKKERLVPAMFHGGKPAEHVPAQEVIPSSQLWKALLVIVIAGGCVYWLQHAAPPPPTSIED
ncbi:MAG TPA: cytochrome b/b6 domain-containing protein [Steroidobacteraceae bacterium]|jgi:cytochrome b|nr:cytochrome b/b6 domain-containing protein [Steroidobacteraceae bacterium]